MSTSCSVQNDGTAAIARVPKGAAEQGGASPRDVLGQIGSLCDTLRFVHTIRTKACRLHNRVSRSGIVRDRPIASVVSAVVLIACRQEGCQSKSCISFSVGKHRYFVAGADAMKTSKRRTCRSSQVIRTKISCQPLCVLSHLCSRRYRTRMINESVLPGSILRRHILFKHADGWRDNNPKSILE